MHASANSNMSTTLCDNHYKFYMCAGKNKRCAIACTFMKLQKRNLHMLHIYIYIYVYIYIYICVCVCMVIQICLHVLSDTVVSF